jgi:hypothetical protein
MNNPSKISVRVSPEIGNDSLTERSSFSHLQLAGRWLFSARMLWFLILLLTVGKTALGLPLIFAEKNSICMASDEICSLGNSLSTRQVQTLESTGISLTTYARLSLTWELITSAIWAGIGLLIFFLRPKEWLALIASAMMIVFISAGTESQISTAYPSLGTAAEMIFNLGNILLFLFIGLFPNGRFSPRWIRWYWLGIVVISVLPSSIWLQNSDIANEFYVIFWVSFLLLGPYSQIYKYRNESTAVERQQTKWFVLGFAAFAGTLLVGFVSQSMLPQDGIVQILIDTFLFDSAGLLIPISIAISILRYRLWDIDLIIRRTLVYGGLTVTLALIYFGGVVLFQGILSAITGESRSEIVTVATTLAIAALFTPLRKRIQQDIDRRFYRKKYSAEQALATFSALARQETDLATLTGQLVSVVQESLQSERVTLWLVIR